LQLGTYIVDMRKDEMFRDLNNFIDLSVKLVETKKDKVYHWVYLLIKLVTAVNVERTIFSAMTFIKNRLTNKMGDSLLDDCLVVLFSGILPYN
jgi:hypothetical protein